MTHHRPGTTVPSSGIYWCTVCKLPKQFQEGEQFPDCPNMCGRGQWQPVQVKEKQ